MFGAGVQASARQAQLHICKEFRKTAKVQGAEGLYSVPKFAVVPDDLCKRLLQAQQGRVLPFAMEIVFIVFYLHG